MIERDSDLRTLKASITSFPVNLLIREINPGLNLLDRTWDLGLAAGKHQQNRKCQPTKPQDDPGR